MVLLDGPPILTASDPLVLSKYAGGTLLVVGVDRIPRVRLREALEALSTVDANLVGLVLNKVRKRNADAYVQDGWHAEGEGGSTSWEIPESPRTA